MRLGHELVLNISDSKGTPVQRTNTRTVNVFSTTKYHSIVNFDVFSNYQACELLHENLSLGQRDAGRTATILNFPLSPSLTLTNLQVSQPSWCALVIRRFY